MRGNIQIIDSMPSNAKIIKYKWNGWGNVNVNVAKNVKGNAKLKALTMYFNCFLIPIIIFDF